MFCDSDWKNNECMPLPFLSPWNVSTTDYQRCQRQVCWGRTPPLASYWRRMKSSIDSFSPSWSSHFGNSQGPRGEQLCINLSLGSYCDLLDTSVSTQITTSREPKIARIVMLEITPDIFKAELLRLGNPTVTPREEFSSQLSLLFSLPCLGTDASWLRQDIFLSFGIITLRAERYCRPGDSSSGNVLRWTYEDLNQSPSTHGKKYGGQKVISKLAGSRPQADP